MSVQPGRPVFSEAQVLAAADLTRLADHAAEVQARHERTLHSWGIADGLRLVPAKDSVPGGGPTFIRLTLTAGLAIDGTGRQIVVAAQVPLDEAAFEQVNGTTAATDRDTWFPVLLAGRDRPAPAEGISTSSCGERAAPTRVVEGFEVSFGRPGVEQGLDDQPGPPIDEGPGRPGSEPWRVLLGFVRWNPDIDQFSEVEQTANNVSIRYAGALADEVAARNGRLELRTRAAAELNTPAVVVDEQDGGRLVFGLHNGTGQVAPLLTVTARGDVDAKGAIKGLLHDTGDVRVQSGQATDGVVLPLPDGITDEQVTNGEVVLHTMVTVRVPPSTRPSGMLAWTLDECRVDDERRVRCSVTWFKGFAATDRAERPAAVDYLVIAAAGKAGG